MPNDVVLRVLRQTTNDPLTPTTEGQTRGFNRPKIESLGT